MVSKTTISESKRRGVARRECFFHRAFYSFCFGSSLATRVITERSVLEKRSTNDSVAASDHTSTPLTHISPAAPRFEILKYPYNI